jgi:hypothetical protein
MKEQSRLRRGGKCKAKKQVCIFTIVVLVFCMALPACKDDYYRNKTYAAIPESSVTEGEKLAAIHCQSCHVLPDPSLLNALTWREGVLPQMGPRLGIFKHNFQYYPSMVKDPFLDSNYYPSRPVLDAAGWQHLINFYLATSPDTLPPQQRDKIRKNNLSFFSIHTPEFSYDSAALSFIKITTPVKLSGTGVTSNIVVNDIGKQKLYGFNAELKIVDSVADSGNIVDLEFYNGRKVICDIGQLNPTNAKLGNLYTINPRLPTPVGNKITASNDTQMLANSLARPVDFASADLNNDGLTDYVVCEFGHLTGAVSWLENLGGDKFSRHVLSAVPGAIKVQITDHNKDGLPDFWVLFTQGDEGIVSFTNLGNGRFHPEKVLRFPPVYGSSYFELVDINKDGSADIVYTCGDNADFSMVLKPYHGVYIFINDGKNNFKQEYFFPLHGCFKAIPWDFDSDGDIDIATIGFFADFADQPEEGFVFLEQKNRLVFEASTFPEGQSGRWLTMDAADIDGDGKKDIILGNFSIRPSETKQRVDWKKGPPFIVLKNRL